jgi:hypothetical protein
MKIVRLGLVAIVAAVCLLAGCSSDKLIVKGEYVTYPDSVNFKYGFEFDGTDCYYIEYTNWDLSTYEYWGKWTFSESNDYIYLDFLDGTSGALEIMSTVDSRDGQLVYRLSDGVDDFYWES